MSWSVGDVVAIAIDGTGVGVIWDVMVGTVAAAITGLALIWLMRNPIPETQIVAEGMSLKEQTDR